MSWLDLMFSTTNSPIVDVSFAKEEILSRIILPANATSAKLLILVTYNNQEWYYNLIITSPPTMEDITTFIHTSTKDIVFYPVQHNIPVCIKFGILIKISIPDNDTELDSVSKFGILLKLSDSNNYSHIISMASVSNSKVTDTFYRSAEKVYHKDLFDNWSANISQKNRGPQIDDEGNFI